MTEPIEIRPQVTAVFEHRKAASDCCGAPLGAGGPSGWVCKDCGLPCSRVLGPPREVTAHG